MHADLLHPSIEQVLFVINNTSFSITKPSSF
nr:MAG TPA: hypothetical protein [Caudoviricetes sp.]